MRWLVIIGTWVRFPGPPKTHLFLFLTCSCAESQRRSTIRLKHPGAKWPQAWIQWSGDGDHGTPSQHMLWGISKVKQA